MISRTKKILKYQDLFERAFRSLEDVEQCIFNIESLNQDEEVQRIIDDMKLDIKSIAWDLYYIGTDVVKDV